MVKAELIGKSILDGLRNSAGAFDLFFKALGHIPSLRLAPVRMVLYKQVYFTGIKALNKIAIIGMLIGVVIITMGVSVVGHYSAFTGQVLVWTVMRELGPLFCTILIIARTCTATAAELGTMKFTREVDSLWVMGIDPVAYLVLPRIIGVTISLFILTFYFQFFTIIGGLGVSAALTDIGFLQHLKGILPAFDFFDVVTSLFKSFIYGLIISSISCYHGLRVEASITHVPQMTTVAVMQCLFTVIFIDGLITVVFFL